MIRRLVNALFCITVCWNCVSAQSIDQIKADRDNYIWGEGSGITLKQADQEALSLLISQISTHVESSFSLLKEEMRNNGKSENFKKVCKSVVNTYSNATLKNTERIVLGNEPDAKVFRYIKQSEVLKVFAEREEKIKGFVLNAEMALENNQIADGLRYYYWALSLLKSHPQGGEMKFTDQNQKSHLLATWIPQQINNIFVNLDIKVCKVDKKEGETLYTLDIRYRNKPIENFDYCYWDGADYSNLISARNGIGLVELYGMATDTKNLKIKAEYLFEGEARIDRELEDVLSQIDPIPFRKSYYNIPLDKPAVAVIRKKASPFAEVKDTFSYHSSIEKVLDAINKKDYTSVSGEFTDEGFDIFKRIVAYGNAKLVGDSQLKFLKDKDKVICRSVPMCFNFKTNDKQFIEEVVFHFNKEAKIESLSFGLSDNALNSIVGKDIWEERVRLVLVNFLEDYKTSYALKRLDYIERIFSDDALIITGKYVKVKPNEYSQFKDNRIVKYNRQTKQQYLKNLKYSFSCKEYINIKFEQSEIRKAGKGGDIFGVQIKQNFFSSNYGDVGYLFLIVDLNNVNEPIIHVRTWQPEITANDSLYDLSNFN